MAQGVYLSQVHRDPRVLLRADWAPAGHEEPVHGPRRGEVGGEIGGRNGQAVQGQVLLQNGDPQVTMSFLKISKMLKKLGWFGVPPLVTKSTAN